MELNNETFMTFTLLAAVVGIFFNVYLHFRNPQIRTDQAALKLREDVDTLSKSLTEVREKHLVSVEKDLKDLAGTIHSLSLNVTRLSTVIDERIPKTVK